MFTESPKIYSKDEEMIEVGEDILNWLQNYSPPPLANNVNLVGRKFKEYSDIVSATEQFQYSLPFYTGNVSCATFFIKNTGNVKAEVKLQISPKQDENDYGYMDDGIPVEIEAGSIIALVPMIFGKFTRVAYKSEESTELEIVVQGQI